MKFLSALALGLLLPLLTVAQIRKDPTSWSARATLQPARVGDVVDIRITAAIADGWHIYSNDLDPNIGPLPTSFKFTPSDDYQLVGKPVPVGVKETYEEVWQSKIRQFSGSAAFVQKIKLLKPNATIGGIVEYSACSDKDGTCLPPAEVEFSVALRATAPVPDGPAPKPNGGSGGPVSATFSTTSSTATSPTSFTAVSGSGQASTTASTTATGGQSFTATASQPAGTSATSFTATTTQPGAGEPAESESLGGFMLTAFLAGLVALLTPCVFPIIPMTVSYFTGQKGGQWKAIVYGLSIIGIYVLIGTLVSRINGPAFANFVSTHWLPNVLFFLVFFVFGLSFLGLFEIVLPNSLVNRADAQSERGGLLGVFFMAFTLVLVSFSCTGPLVGSLLVASAGGAVLKPIVGMAAFSSAFAIPFTLFALFPQWLKRLPKSGGWLNSVKVVLGFLELALALKFLSIADQVYHWHLLDREVYLALWIVLFSLIGFYLLGKIRLPHDSNTTFVSVPRLLLAIGTFAFVVYMIPGMWGAPLKALAGYLPPDTSQDFNLYTNGGQSGQRAIGTSESVKYGDLFKLPLELSGFFDYKEALAYAKTVNKPVFVDFTGHGCVNCREMEHRVWDTPQVLSRLQNDYVVLALYVDDKTELPETDWYTSTYDQKIKKTIGAQNADLQIMNYNNNAQPHYCLVDHTGKLLVPPRNYDLDADRFAQFLDSGKAKFAQIQ